MYYIWQIKTSDIAVTLHRCGTYEPREIMNTAEELGYTAIEEKHDTIEAVNPDGLRIVIAEQ